MINVWLSLSLTLCDVTVKSTDLLPTGLVKAGFFLLLFYGFHFFCFYLYSLSSIRTMFLEYALDFLFLNLSSTSLSSNPQIGPASVSCSLCVHKGFFSLHVGQNFKPNRFEPYRSTLLKVTELYQQVELTVGAVSMSLPCGSAFLGGFHFHPALVFKVVTQLLPILGF